jgi:Fur family peroxide stress response transcriptional regulator
MGSKSVIKILTEKNIKITPQRIAVLEVIMNLKNHPTAEEIINCMHIGTPHVAPGTVYKTLDLFVEKGILKRVKTDQDLIRYDQILERHHHLYCAESERIEDYFDENLNQLLDDYFKSNKIKNFSIEDIKLQLVGKFSERSNPTNLKSNSK